MPAVSPVSFLRVRLKVNVVVDGPRSDGKSVVIVTSPAFEALTVTSIGRSSRRLPDVAVTVKW